MSSLAAPAQQPMQIKPIKRNEDRQDAPFVVDHHELDAVFNSSKDVLPDGPYRRDTHILPTLPLPLSHNVKISTDASNAVFQLGRLVTHISTRMRVFEIYFQSVLALFMGRFRTESRDLLVMPLERDFARKALVLHRTLVMSQETFIVMAVESANINEADSLAQQLRSVLIDAHEHNSDKSIMVYGLVTDFKVFHFGSYDPGKQVFALDRALVLRDLTTKFFLDDMARVAEKLFGILTTTLVFALCPNAEDYEESEAFTLAIKAVQTFYDAAEGSQDMSAVEEAMGLLKASVIKLPINQGWYEYIDEPKSHPSKAEIESIILSCKPLQPWLC